MDVSLQVLLCTSIKRKKPSPKLCWIGKEKEAVFLVDERQVSEIKLRSGNVKKTILKKKDVVTISTSDNGAWLAALHLTGELSLWNKDSDCLQIVPANDVVSAEVALAQGNSLKLHLYVCDDGSRVLLVVHTGSVYLWENTEEKPQLRSQKKRVLPSRWSRIEHSESVTFPGVPDKEATVHAVFIKNEVLGDRCLCAFVFYSGSRLVMTFLALQWYEKDQKTLSAAPHHVHWTQQDCSVLGIAPACAPVKSRGALLALFSRDGSVLTLAVNQKDPKETRVLYINTMNLVTVCGSLRGCGSRDQPIPSRLLRSYWVADMSWTADSLFLACVLKRGSLLLLTCMGELLTLTTSGCSVEFGPAEFIPLHPFITYRPPVPVSEASNPSDSLGSVASESDLMRQRYSVTCHPRLPYMMVSDGYMVTALRFADNISPQNFMKTLLLDAARRLEDVRQKLQIVKSKKNGMRLRTLSSLQASLLRDPLKTPSAMSSVPSFLQEEEEMCGQLEKLLAQEDSEDSDPPDDNMLADPPFSRAERGRLEFASMFDTVHASDPSPGRSDVVGELLRIQRALLTAWAVGVSAGGATHTGPLLHYTVGCLIHFMSILQNPKCPMLKVDKPSKKKARGDPWTSYAAIFHQCLTGLYWDVAPRQTMGHVMKLTAETLRLVLSPHRPLLSKSLLEGFCLLQMVSRSLSAIYTVRFQAVSYDAAHLRTPVFQAIKQPITGSPLQRILQEPPNVRGDTAKSEKRLAVLWRLLYNQTLRYQTRLRKRISLHHLARSAPEVQNEEKAIGSLLCHIQAELQTRGGQILGDLALLPVTGEEYFLLGSYKESVEFLKKQLLEISARGGRRSGALQTRYYLALLYCHLYHYNLNDAQGMCDRLVQELLIRSSLLPERRSQEEIPAGDPPPGRRPLEQVHPEAALAVIRSMGRFMAAYFTNQRLYVFPPHNVSVLAPLHVSADNLPRIVPLQHRFVAGVVRDQNLSGVWTVDYTLDLLLVGGLISEAAWLANKLGDWKMSVSMSVAYTLHRSSVTEEVRGEFPAMSVCLSPAHIFQEKLQSFLGQPPGARVMERSRTGPEQFSDPVEEEDADLLFSSVQEMLKAAVMADAEILTETLHQLMDSAKELSGRLSGLVPDGLYLPAPPLYCPQPSSVSEEDPRDLLLESEKCSRQRLSGVLQRVLLLLRAAHCSLPAAQWYIKQIKRARKIMQKIRAKASLPPLDSLPENLQNYGNSRTVLLKPGPSGEPTKDLVSCSVVVCFRELCALCWMLHVRERLSLSCRQYQKARDSGKLFKSAEQVDSCVIERCFEALEWACRMLPFTRATNSEELIQDLILSLVSELPPVTKVAEIMVTAFPNPEDVRVPLREKYHSVQQRLRHSRIRGPHGEEMMSVIIHNMQRGRVKALRRVQRNIGPVETYLWEAPLDDTLGDESRCYDKYSLGTTSPSRSTITDLGRPQIYSDTDTLSEAVMGKETHDGMEFSLPLDGAVNTGKQRKAASKKSKAKREACLASGPSAPKVGTWEFECNDEEYGRFLDLFLSYLLERDLLHSTDPGIPFLTSFSRQLREHELNSLVFDVHTTLKRKLVRAGTGNVFRAGSCFTLNSESLGDSVNTGGAVSPSQGVAEPSRSVGPTVVLGKPLILGKRSFPNVLSGRTVRSGLFGLHDPRPKGGDGNMSSTSVPAASRHFHRSYRLIQSKQCTPNEELGDELQAKYSREAKLVEWLIRWSDRRLFWSTGKAELCHVAAGTAIRAKTSSAALLTAIWLLEKPYLGRTFIHNAPPGEYIVAPVIQGAVDQKLQKTTLEAVESFHPGRSPPSSIHELDDESEEGPASRASAETSRKQSQERQPGAQEESRERQPRAQEESREWQPGAQEASRERQPRAQEESRERHPRAQEESRERQPRAQEESRERQPGAQEQSQEGSQEWSQEGSQEGSSVLRDEHRLELRSGTDDDQEEESDTQRSVTIAVSIRPVLRQVENLSCGSRHPDREEAAVPKIRRVSPCGDAPASAGWSPPAPQSVSGAAPLLPPAPTANQPESATPDVGHNPQTVPGSEAVRQLLQDEMFRLLQMQQINFMSLMQVVGSSFVALPALQQVLQQTSQMGRIPVVNPAADHSAPQVIHPAPSQPAAAETQRNADVLQTGGAVTAAGRNEQSNKEALQKLPELSIPPSDAGGKIPARLGLLGTAPLHRLPLITPPSGPQKTPILIRPPAMNNSSGFPLLRLQSEPQFLPLDIRPPVREAWAPQSAARRMPTPVPTYPTKPPCVSDPTRTQKTQKWAEPVSRGPPDHPSTSQTASHSHQQPQISLFGSEQNKAGIPLLHLRSDPVLYTPPVPTPGRSAPMLLHLPKEVPDPTKITWLTSNVLQQTNAQRRDPGVTEENSQRVKANIIQSSEDAGDSIKRKNRRTLKEKSEKEKKASVSFRPDDSIITSNNLDEGTGPEIVHRDKPDLGDGNDFVIPFGSFESMLLQQIPETPISSMAELHFLASTMKRPPDIRDASTNTDSAARSLAVQRTEELADSRSCGSAAVPPAPGSFPSHQVVKDLVTKREASSRSGMVVSPLLVAEELPPDIEEQMPPELFLNLQYRHQHQPEKPHSPIGLHGDGDEFPERFADSPDPNLPSSAEVHHLPASVTDVYPPEHIQHADIPEGPQLGDRGPGAVDRVTRHLVSADLTPAPGGDLTLRVRTPRVKSNQAVSRLKEMDVQLQALQNMADGMEHDFANTRLLVNTLETLTSAAQLEPKDVPPRRAGAAQRMFPLSDLAEEEEYDRTSPVGIGSRERPLDALIFSSGDGDLSTALGRSEEMDHSVLQDALQLTGLSDVADILGDLMAGGVSASDLGLTPAQAENLSRATSRGVSRRTPRERADLLRWMKKKQRERLAEHRRKLRELREKEHKPFQSLQTANTSKEIREMQQVKDERDRSLLLEHHGHRVSDAIGLMQEMLSEAKEIPSGTRAASFSGHPASPKGARGAVRSLSAGQEKRKSSSRGETSQPRSTSSPARPQIRGTATFVLPKSSWEPKLRTRSAPSYPVHRRYDPSLPGDRLSQITRRGMLAARNRLNVHSKNTKPVLKAAAKQTSRQDKSSKGTSPLSQLGEFQLEDDYERDIVSPWEIPDAINRILNSSRNSILSQGSLMNGDADLQILIPDNSSESTGSILSRLDWKAIEDMVASVGSPEI
ncbi:ciliogenesis and planar polarity effector 1 isoform 2-T2 [Anomaloglossus baeobatrachus]|uniref:ciliogenesis and planar polarity effector 1 isoform X2 n=1 Tax=Anomaloglossus baeobatrachus TaxID=238106 RepID=UPI003F4FE056